VDDTEVEAALSSAVVRVDVVAIVEYEYEDDDIPAAFEVDTETRFPSTNLNTL
jgi:hypothetical protein